MHDDVSPIDAPRRASWRPGLYLSHVPGIPKLDIRAEAATTDPSSSNGASQYGHFMYWETIQRQGYTNQGQLFGDWIGREDKGGQAWITYHLSGNEWLQVGVRNQKATTYFIPGGTTLNDINFQAVKRIGKDFEINGNFSLRALEGSHLSSRPADSDHHHYPAHLVSGEEDQLLRHPITLNPRSQMRELGLRFQPHYRDFRYSSKCATMRLKRWALRLGASNRMRLAGIELQVIGNARFDQLLYILHGVFKMHIVVAGAVNQ